MHRNKIELPREAKIQFRAIPTTLCSMIEYRLEYRVDPDDKEHRYKIINNSMLFGLIKWTTKIDYSDYWLDTQIFTGYCPEESESHYMNWSLGIKIKDEYDLIKYKNQYKTIEEFENYLNTESNRNYNNWQIKREKFLKESKKVLY